MYIDILHALPFAFLHAADAPVEVGRDAVGQVVGKGNGPIDVEGLMTDEHTVLEAAPCEVFGRGEATVAEEGALVIDDVGVAVEDGNGKRPSPHPPYGEGVVTLFVCSSIGRDTTPSL